MKRIAVTNIGTMVSGDLEKDIIDADTIVVEDGKIGMIGKETRLRLNHVDTVLDAGGTTLIPGLIESHAHPVLLRSGPFLRDVHLPEMGKSKIHISGWLEASMHAGVTTILSAGELTVSGRGRSALAAKELAIAAKYVYKHLRYGGVKVHAGAVFLEKGLTEQDFKEMSQQGVWLVAEIGLGTVQKPEEAKPMVEWAHKYGMKVYMHTGGSSLTGSKTSGADEVMAIRPDIVCHINGGPTSMSMDSVKRLINETDLTLELCYIGNPKVFIESLRMASEKRVLHRVICGSDTPGGQVYSPTSMLQMVRNVASLSNIPASKAVAMCTGNTASVFGLNTGKIEVGKEADLVLLDAPIGSVGDNALSALEAGDVPGICMVMIDGDIVSMPSKFTPTPKHQAAMKS